MSRKGGGVGNYKRNDCLLLCYTRELVLHGYSYPYVIEPLAVAVMEQGASVGVIRDGKSTKRGAY